jgi:hypothetical protein
VSAGTVLKNSWLMPRSAHIGVYLVHDISCRLRTRETYFRTIPRNCVGLIISIKSLKEHTKSTAAAQGWFWCPRWRVSCTCLGHLVLIFLSSGFCS